MTASCCLSSVSDPKDFSNGRNFAAWLGLVPFQYSTGGKPRMLGISKRGNKELRKPFNVALVALVALANKLARIAWSVMATKKPFEIRV